MKAVHRGLSVNGVDWDEGPRHDDDVQGAIAQYLIRDVQIAARCVASPRRSRTGHSHCTRLANRLLPQERNARLRSARRARRPIASPARDPAARCRSATPRPAAREEPESCCRATHPAVGRVPGGRFRHTSEPVGPVPPLPDIPSTATRRHSTDTVRTEVSAPCTPSRPVPSMQPKTLARQGYRATGLRRRRGREPMPRSPLGRAPFWLPPGGRWCPRLAPAFGRRSRQRPARCTRRSREASTAFRRRTGPRRRARWRSPSRTRATSWRDADSRASPRSQHVSRAGGGGRRRGRPTRDPRQPDRLDSRDGCLLKHEFADQNLPRRDARAPPGQIALLAAIPIEHLRHNVGHAEHQPSDRVEITQRG